MKKFLLKKVCIAFVCAAVVVSQLAASIGGVSGISHAAENQDGTLSWDFEATDDIAFFDKTISNYGYVKGYDTFNSGAWSHQFAKATNSFAWPAYGQPYQVKFENIGRSTWGIVSDTNDGYTGSGVPLENGGSYCAAVSTGDGIGGRTLGMVIRLSQSEIIAGREYTLEFDVLSSLTSGTRDVYAGFGKPSERPTSGTEVPWFTSDNAVHVGSAGGTAWKHITTSITSTWEMYEDGYTAFYIAGGNIAGGNVDAKEKLYLDNIVIRPVSENKMLTKLKYGSAWDFEGAAAEDESISCGAYADGNWSALTSNMEQYSYNNPCYVNVSQFKNNQTKGYCGRPANGSEQCVRVRVNPASGYGWNAMYLGTRIRLSKEYFKAGEYTLSFYAASNKERGDICAVVLPDGAQDIPKQIFSKNSLEESKSDKQAVIDWLGSVKKIDLGTVFNYWGSFSGNITLEDSDFSDDGYVTLAIIETNRIENALDNINDGGFAANAYLYLDNISFTGNGTDCAPKENESFSFYMQCMSDTLKDAVGYVPLYDGTRLVSLSAVNRKINKEANLSYNIKIDSALDNPCVKFLLWHNNTYVPITDAYIFDNEVKVSRAWRAKWVDVEGNCYEENENPTVQTDGNLTAAVTFTEPADDAGEFVYAAKVFDRYGAIYSTVSGDSGFDITMPYGEEYSVKLYLKSKSNGENGGVIGEYSKSEFEDMVSYKVANVDNNGTFKIRNSFEAGKLDFIPFTSNMGYDITNTIQANSGDNCLYVHDRAGGWANFTVSDKRFRDGKLSVSVYVKNDESVNDYVRYILRMVIPLEDGTTEWPSLTNWHTYVYADNNNWTKLSGEIDLSRYNIKDEAEVKLNITTSKDNVGADDCNVPFYVDDLMISMDKTGSFYDDTDYLSKISSTANLYPSSEQLPIEDDLAALKDVYKDYFKIGSCLKSNQWLKNSSRDALTKKHFNSVVADGFFKMSTIYPKAGGKYSFMGADKLMKFCYDNGITDIAGHALIWEVGGYNKYTEGKTRDELLSFMKEYITKVINHFNGKGDASEYEITQDYGDWHVPVWDVVNEAAKRNNNDLSTDPIYSNAGANWLGVIGKDYVSYAFKYARDADPTAELRYNDFEDEPIKRNRIYTIVKNVNDEGNYGGRPLVDSIGLQSHYTVDFPIQNARESLAKYASLGTAIDITEFDITAYSFAESGARVKLFENGIPQKREFEQTMMYKELFDLYKEYSDSINRVTFWTTADGWSHFNTDSWFPKTDYAGVFDRNYKAKPQYYALVKTEEELKQMYPKMYAGFDKTRWSFNDEDDVSKILDTGKWSSVTTDYSIISYSQPVIAEEDGISCAKVSTNPGIDAYSLGMRIELGDKQVKIGKTYNVKFKAKAKNVTGNKLYAATANPDTNAVQYNIINNYIKTGTASCGTASENWQTYTAQITPTEEDFKNGHTLLYIAQMPSLDNSAVMAKGTAAEMYIDDIEIVLAQ
ncbi:MAG: endo-1,4-beta-xylanase [Clostridiales bacterium]|nr:endo-1,4-beta-xylanase [Clostridiales bacterium]